MWTRWGARQHVLADDGTAIWIGTEIGAVRWDKATNTFYRHTPYDDLPSWSVYAVAVDAMGGRWFGGSEGLTLLDAGGTWTHFGSANSQLVRSPVVGIAASDGGTLWVSYQLPDGPVSRRDAHGNWQHYPSREAAVMADYRYGWLGCCRGGRQRPVMVRE